LVGRLREDAVGGEGGGKSAGAARRGEERGEEREEKKREGKKKKLYRKNLTMLDDRLEKELMQTYLIYT
jgi:hypothetical protein